MSTSFFKTTPVRFAADFLVGLVLFALVASLVSVSSGQAAVGLQGPPGSPMSFAFAGDGTAQSWQLMGREAAILVLALTFAGLTAFNLSIARHLRAVALHGQSEAVVEAVVNGDR